MRCLSCNVALTDSEATRKFRESEEFVDLCNHCFHLSDFDDDTIIHSNLDDSSDEEENYNEEY
jgi:hypothetical protein